MKSFGVEQEYFRAIFEPMVGRSGAIGKSVYKDSVFHLEDLHGVKEVGLKEGAIRVSLYTIDHTRGGVTPNYKELRGTVSTGLEKRIKEVGFFKYPKKKKLLFISK